MILTFNFQGQIWNLLYLSQKWSDCHKTKTEHIGRTLGLKCHHRVWPWPWPWPWSFKVNYGICYISTKSGPKVRCKDLPDSDWGDFRCRRAIDSSSFILYCPSLSSSGHERKVLDNPHCVHTHGHSVTTPCSCGSTTSSEPPEVQRRPRDLTCCTRPSTCPRLCVLPLLPSGAPRTISSHTTTCRKPCVKYGAGSPSKVSIKYPCFKIETVFPSIGIPKIKTVLSLCCKCLYWYDGIFSNEHWRKWPHAA